MEVVNRNTSEWNYMWDRLAGFYLNKNNEQPCVCMNYGESWQYMDTSIYDGQLKHCFRHRLHPLTNNRQYVKINASEEFKSSLLKP